MNNTCLKSLLWTQTLIDSKRAQFCICVTAVISHSLFWLQIIFFSSLRRKSLHWIYGYMVTDILLLTRFLFSYIIHTVSAECQTNRSWLIFICYFEATADNYFNILEPYILLALNVCRYIQIVNNRNVYELRSKLLIISHLSIYLIPLIFFVTEFSFGWAQVEDLTSNNCDVTYTNIFIQVFNIVFGFVIPISLNVLVIAASLRYVHFATVLRRTQHHATARDKYQRSLTIQFLCFYIIWFTLWSPYVIAEQLSASSPGILNKVTLISLIGIVLDPIIIAALDVHFLKIWRKLWTHIKKCLQLILLKRRRIQPTTMHLHVIAHRNLP